MHWVVWALVLLVVYAFFKRCYLDRRGLPPGPMPLPLLDNFFAFDPKDFRGTIEKLREKSVL